MLKLHWRWTDQRKCNNTASHLSYFFFIVAIQIHSLLRFLALCLCLEHLDNNLLLLNKESALDSENKKIQMVVKNKSFQISSVMTEDPV